ncbi:DUF4350 domain-containing protein [Candidatus Halobonum tyrrellensis]|uniref:DUF4350 domain-containing protein n=1 Tax=Candidatus Halobonum tyrrellensis G22 TaxID=1324957 RepID=V4HJT3_9EURY|nr:DUF4350 domain-containing protein [Candidatus Halobonum tyrrellensis]ESP90023.1 hypothetical protein K933_00632 [Candidatus Halobonum tyrrellensis G22]
MDLPRPAPKLLVAGLALALVVTGVWAASTSAGAFDAYNRGWEGTSELRDEAEAAGASPFVATDVAEYADVTPGETVAFVLSPDERYTDAEAVRLREFVRSGGTLVIAEDYGTHSNPLLERVGASTRVDGAPVRDERNYYGSPDLPVAPGVAESNLTEGVDRLTLNHGTVLDPGGARVLVETSPFAYADENGNAALDDAESLGRSPVVTAETVGDGRVVVVSDPSLFINEMLELDGNRGFARALLSGHATALFDFSHAGPTPPLVRATLTLQRNPLALVATGFALVGAVLLASARLPAVRSRGRANDLPRASRERLRRGLRRRHPDWDPERVDGLIAGTINEGKQGWEDD